MDNSFTPLLTTTDWNAEWKELQHARRHVDDATYWDERAKTFTTKDSPNPYVERFLTLAQVRDGESVFDMGCGTGAIALPLAASGHKVTAADFSGGMLSGLRERAGKEGVTGIETIQMSWEDDWEEHGVAPRSHDVCTASRSIAVDDMRLALLKLSAVARRRVAITLPTGSSPRTDARVLDALGLANRVGRDHLYAIAMLVNLGFEPEVGYIKSTRLDTFSSVDDAVAKYRGMVESQAAFVPEKRVQIALAKLRPWVESQLVENENAGKPDEKGVEQGILRLATPRVVSWAHISWNVEED